VRACVRVRECVRACACVRACVRARVCVCTAEDSRNYFNKCHPNEVFAYVGTRHSANPVRKACLRFEASPLQLCMSRKKYIALVCSETWALPRFVGGRGKEICLHTCGRSV
jgi:hypothetical protein